MFQQGKFQKPRDVFARLELGVHVHCSEKKVLRSWDWGASEGTGQTSRDRCKADRIRLGLTS